MIKSKKLYYALLAGTILSAPAWAIDITPTLDTLKSQGASLSGEYNLTSLDGTLPEGAAQVEINGGTYYFTPSGNDAALLTILSGTPASNLIEDVNGIFDLNGTKYNFNTAALPSSAFEYTQGSENDYNFTIQESDADGNLTTQYYKVTLKPETFATSENISWSTQPISGSITGSVEVNLPGGGKQTLYYAYSNNDGDTQYNNQQHFQNSLGGDVNADFTGLYGGNDWGQYGGAINNNSDHTIGNITGDFVNNYTASPSEGNSQGGAINNDGAIGNISGDFVGNKVPGGDNIQSIGGAIYNSGTTGDITGNFIGNSTSSVNNQAFGGALANFDSTNDANPDSKIGNITGNFIGNSATSSNGYVKGGAIINQGWIDSITGDFIGNSAHSDTNYADGGAIDNNPKGSYIGSITGDFISNSVSGNNAYGGAINNYYGEIGNITGSFIGNTVSANNEADGGAIDNNSIIGNITGNFIDNSVTSTGNYAYGGAIYNETSDQEGVTTGIENITGDFIGNKVQANSNALGGAIYNTSNIKDIEGDFTNNTVVSNLGTAYGGAIYNNLTPQEGATTSIGNISGNFSNNSITASTDAFGGAIYNYNASIGNITGDFTNNSSTSKTAASLGGSIYNYGGTIEDIEGDFDGNSTMANNDAHGGAIYNTNQIGTITGNFTDNTATSTNMAAWGGAIYNVSGSITEINGDFANNSTSAQTTALGGAINNHGSIGTITSNFDGNTVQSNTIYAQGGAIYNESSSATIDGIIGDFSNNQATGNTDSQGGAIFNNGAIGDIDGNFENNTATGTNGIALGGAIYNYSSTNTIGNITGDFTNNTVDSSNYAQGGAVHNRGIIQSISGDFEGNTATSQTAHAQGGAIYNLAAPNAITSITGNFTDNNVEAALGAEGGAIYNHDSSLGTITGDFSGNYAQSTQASARGGAFYSGGSGTIDSISGDFTNNYAKTTNADNLAFGGAVYTSQNLTFTTNGQDRLISGNYTQDSEGKDYNAIYIQGSNNSDTAPTITFDVSDGGNWVINDSIEGGFEDGSSVTYDGYYYNLAFIGDEVPVTDKIQGDTSTGHTTQYISMNNDIINANQVLVEGTTLRLGKHQYDDEAQASVGNFTTGDGSEPVTVLTLRNATLDIHNNLYDTINLAGWNASTGTNFLHIDVDVENMKADELHITGDVEGTTQLIIHPSSDADIRGESIVFAQSTNDNEGSEESFEVYRVYQSPYMFDIAMTGEGTTEHEWSLFMNDVENDDFMVEEPDEPGTDEPGTDEPGTDEPGTDEPGTDEPDADEPSGDIPSTTNLVYAEVIAYDALPAAALEQTRGMIDNISNQVKNSRVYSKSCSFVDSHWNGEPYYNLWVNPTYYVSNIDSPVDIDAKIWGIEAGGDIQHDINNRLGIFVSYRQGNYDMDGAGDRYYSTIGSEIDIDSYIAGLYYRYDKNNWWGFGTLYGGIQKADFKTDDGMKADTDGYEFGASVEGGYDYALSDTLYLTPELGVYYTHIDYDNLKDCFGKEARYDNIDEVELEAGLKLTKTFMMDEGYANAYIKPSIVQTLISGGDVHVTNMDNVDAIEDATLGRIEMGGSYSFTDNLSAYCWANYTFGTDYEGSAFGLGLDYAF